MASSLLPHVRTYRTDRRHDRITDDGHIVFRSINATYNLLRFDRVYIDLKPNLRKIGGHDPNTPLTRLIRLDSWTPEDILSDISSHVLSAVPSNNNKIYALELNFTNTDLFGNSHWINEIGLNNFTQNLDEQNTNVTSVSTKLSRTEPRAYGLYMINPSSNNEGDNPHKIAEFVMHDYYDKAVYVNSYDTEFIPTTGYVDEISLRVLDINNNEWLTKEALNKSNIIITVSLANTLVV